MNTALFNLVILMLLISGISMAILGLYGRKFATRIPAAVPYSLLMFLCASWAILYAVQLLAGSLPLDISYIIAFHNLRFLFLPFIPFMELWLVVAFVQRTEWLRKDWAILALILPAAAVILAITTPFHLLFRSDFRLNTAGPLPVLDYTDSLFYQVYNSFLLLTLIVAMLVLIFEGRKRGTLFGKQSLLLLTALVFPTIINYLFVYGITPIPGVNMTAVLLWVPALLYTIALFRYRFLDIVPVARNRLIEIMNTPVLVLDTGGRIVDFNPAAAMFFSRPAGDIPGRTVPEIAPDWPEFADLCNEQGTCRYNLVRGTGPASRFYIGSAEPLMAPAGEPEGRLILLQDITDLKIAERELRESEKKFSLAFRSAPYALTITRMSDGTILDANDGFEQISGYLLTDIIGKRAMALDLWADPADREAVAQDITNGVRISGREYRFMTKTGQIITGLYSAEVIQIRGEAYVLSSISDITGRKRAEEEREHLIRKLREKNAELDRFAYTVSHDLKSPLISIRGFADLLAEDLAKGNPDLADQDIRRIHEAAETMDRIITTLLTLSRSGRRVDEPVPVPFGDLAREAVGLIAGPAAQRHVRVVVAEEMPVVHGDRTRLLQVMTNLVDNAIKFMGSRADPVVEIGVKQDTEGTVFFVRDNGTGIAKENLARVFGLFERFSDTTAGSGVGLATAKRIIEAHGGKIWAESEGEGKGTTVCFTLPVHGPPGTDTNNNMQNIE